MHSATPPTGLRLRTCTPRERIIALADPGGTQWLDQPRPSPYLARFHVAAQADDGIVTARVRIDGQPVLVAAQDERFLRGSVGAEHGDALRLLCERALQERPVALLVLTASGGVRLHEANAGELSLARALRAMLGVRMARIPVLALAVGDVFGGMSVVACAADQLALLPGIRIGVSGPAVIDAVKGIQEVDASNRAAVDALFGAKARARLGTALALDDDPSSIRQWLSAAIANASPPMGANADRIEDTGAAQAQRANDARHALLGKRLQAMSFAEAVALPPPTSALFETARPCERGWLWRAPDAYLLAPLQANALGPAETHAIDGELRAHLLDPSVRAPLHRETAELAPLIIVEDSRGHAVGRDAERAFLSEFLAHHASILALVRHSGRSVIGLLSGTGHSAAFFVNALQSDVLFALPDARVEAMAPEAIERVTGVPARDLIEEDPLLGQPVRHFAALGGSRAIGDDPTIAQVLALAKQRDRGTSDGR